MVGVGGTALGLTSDGGFGTELGGVVAGAPGKRIATGTSVGLTGLAGFSTDGVGGTLLFATIG